MAWIQDSVETRPVRFGLVGTYAVVVLVVSVVPVPDGTAPSLGPFGLVTVDKWIHAGTYALLALLVATALLARSTRALLAVAGVCVVYGAGIELLQATLSARRFEFLDLVANAVGIVLAVSCWWGGTRWHRLRVDTD